MRGRMRAREQALSSRVAVRRDGSHVTVAREMPARPAVASGARRASPASAEAPIRWTHTFEEGGLVKCRFGRQGASFVAEWPDIARLTCDASGNNEELRPKAGASMRTVAKLRGVARVLIGDLRGGLGVHASSVALGSRAVLIVGEADAGKSTTAAELCLRHGARFLADDVALIESKNGRVEVVPSEKRHYLTPASGKALGVRVARSRLGPRGKAAIVPARVAARSHPLGLVVFLGFDDSLQEARQSPLRGADAVRRLLGSLYRFDLTDRAGELDRVTRIYQQARFLEILRPRKLPSVTQQIVRAMSGAR